MEVDGSYEDDGVNSKYLSLLFNSNETNSALFFFAKKHNFFSNQDEVATSLVILSLQGTLSTVFVSVDLCVFAPQYESTRSTPVAISDFCRKRKKLELYFS